MFNLLLTFVLFLFTETLFFNCLDLEDMDYPIACFVYKTADDFVLRKKCYKTATNKNTNQR